MVQPEWFIVDERKGIDQKGWLLARIKRDVLDNLHRIDEWKQDVIKEFEEEFPRDITKTFYKKRRGKQPEIVGEETVEQARERTKNRVQQLKYWFTNHLKKHVEALRHSTGPEPEHLTLQEYPGEHTESRGRSARDFFVADHPDIRASSSTAATADGVNSRSERQRRCNLAYTAAWEALSNDEKNEYMRRSKEDIALKKSQRELAKSNAAVRNAASAEIERTKLLNDLQYSIHNDIIKLSEKTGMEIVVIAGGEDGSGELRKWIFSNRTENDPYNFANVIRQDSSAAHGVLEDFDEHLRRLRVIRKQNASPNAGATEPATAATPSASSTEATASAPEGSIALDSTGSASALVQNEVQSPSQAPTTIPSEDPPSLASPLSPVLPPTSPPSVEDTSVVDLTKSAPSRKEVEIQPGTTTQVSEETGKSVQDVPVRKRKRARRPSITPEPDAPSSPRRPRNTALAAAKTIKAVANNGRRKQLDSSKIIAVKEAPTAKRRKTQK